MVAAAICVVMLLFLAIYHGREKERPIDEDELRFLRRMSDRNRTEEELFH